MNNKELFKQLRSESVNYLLCDLHVHSIASADILQDDIYQALSSEEKKIIKNLSINRQTYVDKWKQYEEFVLKTVSIEEDFNLIEKRRNEIAAINRKQTFNSSYGLSLRNFLRIGPTNCFS